MMMRIVKEIAVIGLPLWMALAIALIVGMCAAGRHEQPKHQDWHHGGAFTACHCYEG